LGSSSTLIQLLSQWADINPYLLLKNSFKGSGYDIACASANGPILYQLIHDTPQITPISFPTEFLSNGYFVYLGNKQLSDQEIKKYSELKFDRELLRQQITEITNQLAQVNNGVKFCALLEKHEDLISQAIGYPKVKDRLFPTIKGTFKSLGAWGGDFVLFIGTESQIQKIKKMGYSTILPWSDMLRLN
jgi:mevalonate kinase